MSGDDITSFSMLFAVFMEILVTLASITPRRKCDVRITKVCDLARRHLP